MLTRAEFLAGGVAAAGMLAAGCGKQLAGGEPTSIATTGLAPGLIERVVDAARQLPRLQSLIIARHGDIVERHRLRGPDLDQPVNIKSASKSVIAALTGMAIQRGVIEDVDAPIAPFLEADLPTPADPRLSQVTIDHLLSMRAGLERTSGRNYGAWVASPNWVRFALARPFVDDPGGRMLYSTGSSHLMSAILTRASGQSTHALAERWLGEPLGIDIPPWPRDPQGIFLGGNEMLMSPLGLLRFAELYRREGRTNDRQLIAADWIDRSWRPRTASPFNGFGYGYGWFAKSSAGHAVRFAWGYGGQMAFVVPSLALSVVMTSDPSPHPRAESHLPTLHALLDDGIIPAAIAGSGG